MTYGTPQWRPWVLDEEQSRPFLKRALDHGINFFDTADMYSRGVSEEVLGRALRDFNAPRDQIVVATRRSSRSKTAPIRGGCRENTCSTRSMAR
jgi:aryl-alcohol dehydrogenase-like predicted oxidoreductase